jgi:hypothetical protein
MSKKSRTLIDAETNLIRKFLENNVERNLSHYDIIDQLGISRATYFRHVKRIQQQDAKVWDNVYLGSAKYRATELMELFNLCIRTCKEIIDDKNTKPSDRIEAARTASEAAANILKLSDEGPTFKPSLRLSPYNNDHEELNNNNKKQLPN